MSYKGNINRRDFLKKTLGFTSMIGVIAMIPIIESCSKNDDTYTVNTSACTGCKKCVSVCSADAITISNNKASIDSSKCLGCGKCARTCPEGAIS